MSFSSVARVIGIATMLFGLTLTAMEHWPTPGPTPPNPPEPPKPAPVIDSPFPADGYWLIIGSESEELSGVEVVAAAEAIRTEQKERGLVRKWSDYDRSDLEKPWQEALDWAERKGGGKPYFVARRGNKAAEGPLTGNLDAQLKTLTTALEGLR